MCRMEAISPGHPAWQEGSQERIKTKGCATPKSDRPEYRDRKILDCTENSEISIGKTENEENKTENKKQKRG